MDEINKLIDRKQKQIDSLIKEGNQLMDYLANEELQDKIYDREKPSKWEKQQESIEEKIDDNNDKEEDLVEDIKALEREQLFL